MDQIATLTMNPTVDASCEVDRVVDTHKMRGRAERYSPSGGGINVARIFVRLGGNARCYYPAGGPVGEAFHNLADLHQLVRTMIPISGNTRISTTVQEKDTGREFRFVPEGPEVSEPEWQACLAELRKARCSFLVASGSLPRGVPDDFYARVGRIAREIGARFALDTSGRAMEPALAGGDVSIFKPSLGELRQLVGGELERLEDIRGAAAEIVSSGRAKTITVTMGHRGAVLVDQDRCLYVPGIPVTAKSAVGAGDSFLAAMLFKLSVGAAVEEAFRYGMAAGTAAVVTPGTDLCHPDEIERMLRRQEMAHRTQG